MDTDGGFKDQVATLAARSSQRYRTAINLLVESETTNRESLDGLARDAELLQQRVARFDETERALQTTQIDLQNCRIAYDRAQYQLQEAVDALRRTEETLGEARLAAESQSRELIELRTQLATAVKKAQDAEANASDLENQLKSFGAEINTGVASNDNRWWFQRMFGAIALALGSAAIATALVLSRT